MRHKSNEMMDNILKFINDYHETNLHAPSITEIANEVHAARSTVHDYLVTMDEKGMLSYSNGQAVTKQMSQLHHGIVNAPIAGTISCGLPESAECYIEDYVPLPRSIFGDGEFFILRADGYSMVNAGIEPGDYVVIRKQDHADPKDIIVALVDGQENTLKRLMRDNKKGCFYLHPENDEMNDMYFTNIQIQGIAVSVIKNLRSGNSTARDSHNINHDN